MRLNFEYCRGFTVHGPTRENLAGRIGSGRAIYLNNMGRIGSGHPGTRSARSDLTREKPWNIAAPFS